MQPHAYYARCAGDGISRNHDGLAKAGLGRQERPGAGPLVGDKPRRFRTLFRLLLGGITRPTPWIRAPYRGTGHAFAGITMALRRPHKRMKMAMRRGFAIVWWSCRSPPLLDSSFRWNDETGGGSLSRIVVRDMLS